MAQTVVGMFDNASEAEQAVQKLTSKGFSRDMIDVTSSGISSSSDVDTHDHEEESGITRFFKSLFSSDDDHDRDKYIHVARRSNSIVTVHAQTADQAEEAADILDDCGAVNVDEKAAAYGVGGRGNYNTGGSTTTGAAASATNIRDTESDNDYRDARSRETLTGETTGRGNYDSAGTTTAGAGITNSTIRDTDSDKDYRDVRSRDTLADETTGRGDRDTTATATTGIGTDSNLRNADSDNDYRDVRSKDTTDETTKIPVIEETMEVGKREVLTGGRRLRSRIIEKPVEEVVRLREENVNVERTSVDRPATNEDFDNFKEREIEVTEKAEVPVVTKEARVVEEVRLDKEVTERTETISDTVRKTEVDVEEINKDTDRNDRDYRNTSNDRSDRF